ncbi:hypothetical protein EIP86_008410 [Pleurotus ostreatoroseus]|nr:hypothetical protein EIP86_008410 [Pleurotus ostreatoroseus]
MARGASGGSKAPKPAHFAFINLSATEASGAQVPLKARRLAANVYLEKLTLTPEQHTALSSIYKQDKCQVLTYSLDEDSQTEARAFLAAAGLDDESREDLGDRWSIRWRRNSGKEKESEETCRVLYQCDCGYDHKAAGHKRRLTAVGFTGCLAHAEVLYQQRTHHVLYVKGFFEHNQGCQDAHLDRFPARPVHPAVYRVALDQLKVGASLAEIQEMNRYKYKTRTYPGQTDNLDSSPYRWLLQKSDTRSLYRQYNRLQGINVSIHDYINVDEWLDENSPSYNPTIKAAVFHYAARAQRGDRFEVCVATAEMKEAAWRYAHRSQIILDGTFGICQKKLLLFIVMGLDRKRRGVPIAFLLFTPPAGNRFTAGGYNTDILEKLLHSWVSSLGIRNGEVFTVLVAITDTDLKERGALVRVFSSIWLLICKFHLRQCWTSHSAQCIKGTSIVHSDLKGRVRKLEEGLVASVKHTDALQLVHLEKAHLHV